MKDRMLVIPGSFVPYNDTVTLLTYKRLRNIDMDVDVFCFKGKEDQSIVEELSNDKEFSKFNIMYTSDLDWAVPRNYPLRLPISIFLMNKYVLDALKVFEKGNYKYIYTSIVPGISHIAGNLIKKKHPEVVWYASFSDPFKNSPYKDADLSNKNFIYRIMFNVGSYFLYNNRYEEVAIKNADRLIFICDEQRDFTLGQYDDYESLKKKSIIYPLTYIPDWKMYKDLIDIKHVKSKPLQAVHLGRLYGLRKIDGFIEALKQLKQEYPDLSKKIVFHQYSEIQIEDLKNIKGYNLEDLFVVHDKVSYLESVNIMKKADVLVLFDTLMHDKQIQPYLPSKIVEYLMLKKQILAICDDNSPSYRILNEYGFKYLGSEIDIIKKNIIALIDDDSNFEYSLDKLNNDKYDKLLFGQQ